MILIRPRISCFIAVSVHFVRSQLDLTQLMVCRTCDLFPSVLDSLDPPGEGHAIPSLILLLQASSKIHFASGVRDGNDVLQSTAYSMQSNTYIHGDTLCSSGDTVCGMWCMVVMQSPRMFFPPPAYKSTASHRRLGTRRDVTAESCTGVSLAAQPSSPRSTVNFSYGNSAACNADSCQRYRS